MIVVGRNYRDKELSADVKQTKKDERGKSTTFDFGLLFIDIGDWTLTAETTRIWRISKG